MVFQNNKMGRIVSIHHIFLQRMLWSILENAIFFRNMVWKPCNNLIYPHFKYLYILEYPKTSVVVLPIWFGYKVLSYKDNLRTVFENYMFMNIFPTPPPTWSVTEQKIVFSNSLWTNDRGCSSFLTSIKLCKVAYVEHGGSISHCKWYFTYYTVQALRSNK